MAPDVTEHEQSQYLVRCSLLSLGIFTPYFIHSPFFFPWHRGVLVDSLASYSELTSLLVGARSASRLSLPSHLYGVSATTSAGTVVALWTDSLKPVPIRVAGMASMTVQDMYGNPLQAAETLQLTGSPVYLIGQGVPTVTGGAMLSFSTPRSLPAVASWKLSAGVRMQPAGNGLIRLTSQPTKYGTLLKSPVENVIPNSCYVISPALVLHRGGVNVLILDADTNKILRNEYVYTVNGNDQYQPRIRFKTRETTHLQISLTGCNPREDAVSDLEVGSVIMSDCP
jgi:hypothetical protein